MWKIEHYLNGVCRVSDIVSWHLQLIPIQNKIQTSLTSGVTPGLGAVLMVVVAIYDAASDKYDAVALEINGSTKLIKVE